MLLDCTVLVVCLEKLCACPEKHFAEFGMSGNECHNNPQQKGHYTDVSRFIQNCEEVNQSDQTKELDLMITKMKTLMKHLEILLMERKKNGRLLTTVQDACRTYIESVNDGIDNIQEMILTDIYVSETGKLITVLTTNVENLFQLSVDAREVYFNHSVPQGRNRAPFTLKYRTINKTGDKSIKMNDEEHTPWITACACMPNDEFVLCDSYNQKIKLLGLGWEIKDSIQLGSYPWGVSIVNSETVVVTLPDIKQLQYLQVFPKLKTICTIQLNKECWGICVFDNELYVSLYDLSAAADPEIGVLDCFGNLKRLITVHNYTNNITNITINPVSKKLYISGGKGLCCFTPGGKLLYGLNNENCPFAAGLHGLCVDDDDNLLVCNSRTNEVKIATESGLKDVNVLLINSPFCVAARRSDRSLVFGCWSEKLVVFKLGQQTFV